MNGSHVLLVISSLGGGGAERVIVDLAAFMVAQGLRVTLMTLEGARYDHYCLPEGVRRVRMDIMWESKGLWNKCTSAIKRIRMMRQTVCGVAPDVVVSFIDTTNVRMLLALMGTKIPVIVSERTDPRHHSVGYAWNLLRRLLYPFAAQVVVQTDGVAGWARSWLPGKQLAVIPNAVRSVNLGATDKRPDSMPPQRVVLGMGRLSNEKGFDRLISAFERSGLANCGWVLVILGEGPARGQLEKLISDAGLTSCVMLPGMQRTPEEWLCHADIFVLSSRYEGFPNVLLEAMQCGVASVSFDCECGPAEIIHHDRDGLLVPPDDVGALSAALRRLAGDDSLRTRLGQDARAVALRFSRDAIYKEWVALCEKVISQTKHIFSLSGDSSRWKDEQC